MRISDWSSDVCSSDLRPGRPVLARLLTDDRAMGAQPRQTLAVAGGELNAMDPGGRGQPVGDGRNQPLQPFSRERGQGDHIVAAICFRHQRGAPIRSEEHTSELQSLMRISYAVFCLKKKNNTNKTR